MSCTHRNDQALVQRSLPGRNCCGVALKAFNALHIMSDTICCHFLQQHCADQNISYTFSETDLLRLSNGSTTLGQSMRQAETAGV